MSLESSVKVEMPPYLFQVIAENGYQSVRHVPGQGWCALLQFAFTWGLVVNLGPDCYERRYCFEHRADAAQAFAAWNGVDHPGGPWIKCKGLGIDLLNPDFGMSCESPSLGVTVQKPAAILHLNLKADYFDQIKAGVKLHEFRLHNDYWRKRLLGRTFDGIVLKKGYPKTGDSERTLERPWRGFEVREIDHPHFGSAPVSVFAIKVNE